MMKFPSGWKFSIRNLARRHKDKKDSVSSALERLIELGYIKREGVQKRNEKGLYESYDYVIFDNPLLNKDYIPCPPREESCKNRQPTAVTDFPDTEQTVADNPPTNNTVFKNTVSRNTDLNKSKEEEEEDVDARAYIDLDAFSRKLMKRQNTFPAFVKISMASFSILRTSLMHSGFRLV